MALQVGPVMGSAIKIVLTGGGTAGHVMPNLALLPELKRSGFEPIYIGSKGVERDLVTQAGIPFREITCGKLRRYFSFENAVDIFKVMIGIVQAMLVLVKEKPKVVFSKGGFVAVPVCIAAWCLGIPVVSHESDYSPGMANRIIGKFAFRILYTFDETIRFLPKEKSSLVLTPIRQELFSGNAEKGLELCGFRSGNPVILVMGGSQGAQRLNKALLESLPILAQKFNIVHLTGKGKSIPFSHANYKSFEFLGNDLPDVLAMTDYAICRAGANSIFELLALCVPMLLVPLEFGSRGDQILNAKSFVSKGWAHTISEAVMTPERFQKAVSDLVAESPQIKASQKRINSGNNNGKLIEILKNAVQG